MLADASQRKQPPALVMLNHPDKQLHTSTIQAAAFAAGIPVLTWPDGRDELIRWLWQAPRWLLSVYFGHLVDGEVLAAAGGRAVNCHPSYLPWGRGTRPSAKVLEHGDPAGVTLHVMVAELDAGPILIQRRVPVYKSDTVPTLGRRCAEAARMLCRQWPDGILTRWPGEPQSAPSSDRHGYQGKQAS